MTTQKKLKRGLKDISPLFRKKDKAQAPRPETAFTASPSFKSSSDYHAEAKRSQFVGVLSCDGMDDSFLLSSYLASQMHLHDQSCLVLSIEEEKKKIRKKATGKGKSVRGPFKHVSLDWQSIVRAWEAPQKETLKGEGSFDPMIFFDLDVARIPAPQQFVSLLDKCILLVQPTLESLMECYRSIKTMYLFNPHLEYFLIYEGQASDPRSKVLFERLSEMSTRRLGIDVVWLGCTELMKQTRDQKHPLALEHLFFQSAQSKVSTERQALEQLVLQTCLEVSRGAAVV